MDHMMFDQTIDPNDPAVFEVTRRLEAYADLRLSPSAAAAMRMRMTVMGAAHRQAALTNADAATALAARVATAGTTRVGGARNQWRRAAAAAFAATLTLGIVVGTVSAAKPGGPLYEARMWVEMAALPSDPMARVGAEASRLEARLIEVQAASDAGDAGAAQAALTAYAEIADEAEAASAGNPAATAAIEATVSRHLAVLTLLADQVPAAARTAIEHAVASSTKFLGGVDPANGDTTNGNHAGPPPGGGSPTGHDAQPAATPTTTPTATPTAKPDKPAATPDPGKPAVASPKPGKTPNPSPANGGGPIGHDGPQPSK